MRAFEKEVGGVEFACGPNEGNTGGVRNFSQSGYRKKVSGETCSKKKTALPESKTIIWWGT
jgi:hypothetical protein